ncbi:MAG: S-methyl-5-thioribose-1-phosphate isomerase [Candidatus Desulfofervidus auxilii]|nr:S-methyl-5-thioribose-1-phosphate isomerase [Candidatus Desulfofervidus auxilii]
MIVKPIWWEEGQVFILDQRLLPEKIVYLKCTTPSQVAAAIRNMAIRGAPAIGIAAAMGIALGVFYFKSNRKIKKRFLTICEMMAKTRPTARNLFWAIERMKSVFNKYHKRLDLTALKKKLVEEAQTILEEDISTNKKIGKYGKSLIKPYMKVLTHCNAGALATGGYGTALGVIRAAWETGIKFEVFADETRPYLQGARLTAWELKEEGIPVTVITDNTAGYLMKQGRIDLIIVGADRIAANGDTANKIGTYTLAVLAKQHHIPFYVAAPFSTIDLGIPDGSYIPIEERKGKEVTYIGKRCICPKGVNAIYYAFDVTPWEYITGIITEKGIFTPPYAEKFKMGGHDG